MINNLFLARVSTYEGSNQFARFSLFTIYDAISDQLNPQRWSLLFLTIPKWLLLISSKFRRSGSNASEFGYTDSFIKHALTLSHASAMAREALVTPGGIYLCDCVLSRFIFSRGDLANEA